MLKEAIIESTISYVKQELQNETSGHDWFHIERVVNITKKIAAQENADEFICVMAALLHDVADEKVAGSEDAGINQIMVFLQSQQMPLESIRKIANIIATMSFKGGGIPPVETLEAKVVQDADRLDALGAIGIARCFVYSGSKGRAIYDPEIPVRLNISKQEYRNTKSTAINHFYEKLLKLKHLMNTDTGRRMAEQRHSFLELYLDQFYAEWNIEQNGR